MQQQAYEGFWGRFRCNSGWSSPAHKAVLDPEFLLGVLTQVSESMYCRLRCTLFIQEMIMLLVTPGRFELPTCGLGNRRSIHLSYGAMMLSVTQPKQ